MSGSGFTPVFGPNGAVMNAPSMTPEMRAKFDAPGGFTRREGRNLALIFLGTQLLLAFAKPVHAFLTANPWWSGVLTGVVGAIALRALWQFVERTLKRWELPGRGRRMLGMPAWARVVLTASDIGMGACMAAMFVGQVVDLKGEYWLLRGLSVAGLVVFAMTGWFMRWLGDELKWSWRPQATLAGADPARP
jgi:hypothetical protein